MWYWCGNPLDYALAPYQTTLTNSNTKDWFKMQDFLENDEVMNAKCRKGRKQTHLAADAVDFVARNLCLRIFQR